MRLLFEVQVVFFRVASALIPTSPWSYTGTVSGALHVHYFPDTQLKADCSLL